MPASTIKSFCHQNHFVSTFQHPCKDNNENEEIPELILESFQKPPFVDFGKVIIGSEVTKTLIVHNPAVVKQQLKISKLPKPEDGFTISNSPITLDADQKILFNFTWRPEKVGNVRGKVHFVTSFNEKFEVTLLGAAAEKEKLKRRAKRKRRVINAIDMEPKIPKRTQTLPDIRTAAAIIIQKNYKGYKARKRFSEMKIAACKIQRCWRSYVKQRQSNKRYTFVVDVKNKAAMTVQKHWKGYKARKNFVIVARRLDQFYPDVPKAENDASFEQISNGSTEQNLDSNRQSTCINREENEKATYDRDQKLEAAALTIQKHWKGYKARKRFSETKLSTCKIQRCWRSYVEQRQSNKRNTFVVDVRNNAALTIQKHWKGYKVRRNFAMIAQRLDHSNTMAYNRNQKLEAAALTIQKHWKGYKARQRFFEMQRAACKIQRRWRSYVKQRQSNKRNTFVVDVRNATLNIQKHWKGYKARKRFSEMKIAACKIQRCWRSYVKQCQSNKWNRFVADLRNNAAVTIQKHWKGYIARKRFSEMKRAACKIQRCWRSYVKQRQTNKRNTFVVEVRNAAVTIQKHWKGYKARKRFSEMKRSACKIQRCWRSYVKQRQTNKRNTFVVDVRNNAAIIIQKNYKGYKARKRFSEMKIAACKIQRCWRSYVKQRQTNKRNTFVVDVRNNAAVTIQKHWKGYKARQRFSEMKRSACKIQRCWRSYVKQRQSNKRNTFVVDVRNNAALTIQKHWKGYKVRKNSVMIAQKKHDIVPVLNTHTSQDSLQIKDTPALPLGFRTDIAFKKLINYRKFCQLQAALSSLETTTKISPESCCKIASPSTVDTILDIIKRSNRSEPSKLVISHAFSILLSLIKFEKTQHLVVDRRAVIDICIEKAKVHNKVENIFCKCLTLVYLMVVKSSDRDTIISDPRINKNLMSLITLEASFIKSHKKRKISREIVFYPYWSSAKNVIYEFTDRFTALEHVNYIFKSKLF